MDDFFSDSDGEKAVEDLLSQAMESTVLEQVAAINCAGFTDSGLPSHLETRFQRLKSFPSSTAKPTSLSTKSFSLSHPAEFKKVESVNEAKSSDSGEEKNGERSEKVSSTCLKKSPVEKFVCPPLNCLTMGVFHLSRRIHERKCRRREENHILPLLGMNFPVEKDDKKAMEVEDRISREAEKIVKWAKHASARMDVSSIEDELSDDENAKFP
ncbi:hypothetical protein Sango_1212400 [Sesamum angolense]|uniref:Uncharacterized protein n=1 Tax=Sesamum angolense TaxID=2727404 RepID=A0AAE1WWL3_9LAMI|nr:hypothetical protein Sango_1212400 [Sesamum angolense]